MMHDDMTTISIYARNLITEARLLHGLLSRWTLTKILENEEDKKTIKESFKWVDEYTKDFQVRDSPSCERNFVICCLQLDIIMSIERNTDEMQESLKVCVLKISSRDAHTDHKCQRLCLDSWPHSQRAAYNANFEGTTTFNHEPCTKETCVDILEHIYKWALNSSSDSPHVFWLMGQAGSGKSTITYTVTDHFDDVDDDGSDLTQKFILGANFFCSRQFEEMRRRKYIIPTIAYQLALQSRSYAHALLHVNKPNSVNAPDRQMKDFLVGPWQESAGKRRPELRPYLIVIDALDEIEENGGLAFLQALLETFSKGHLRGLKVLVTSRPDPKLAALCSSFKYEAVCRLNEVPTDTVKADIRMYLGEKLPVLQSDVLDNLSQKADDLFIYAATVVRYIQPRGGMTTDEQLYQLRTLADHMPVSSKANKPSLIDTLYQDILRDAFRDLDNTLVCNRLKILHTLLCTEERVSASVVGELSDVADAQLAKVVIDGLYAVLYVRDNQVLWYHASFPDFMFTQE